MFFHVAIACFLGVAAAAPSGLELAPVALGVDSVSVPRYNFNYAVNDPYTGDNKAQSEIREGGVVKGSYSLTEPDGTLRVVEYAADPVSGFNAVVKRLGPAGHPPQLIAKPIIAAPIATKVITPVAPILSPAISFSAVDAGLGLNGLGLGHNGLGLNGLGLNGLGLNGLGLNGLGLNGLGIGGWGLSGNLGLWKH